MSVSPTTEINEIDFLIDPRSRYDNIIMSRIGKFYPNITSDFDMADCPPFWRNRSIKINQMNLKDQGYLKNLKISSFIAIGLDLIVGVSSGVLIWRYSDMKKVYKRTLGFGKFKFILTTIIFGFGMPLFDTCTGKRNYSGPKI